ncbi:MAG: VIT domain-containing protein [bacterium]
MPKKIMNLLCLFTTLVSSFVLGEDRLRVGDVRSAWYTKQGTIEEAVIAIRPQGIYMEYGLYLTFSARGTGYAPGDSLEVQFHFNLPADAIVHDSWLWVGDEIVRAKIMDKWTASSIYENIVRRRRDPSILFKRGQGEFELRIFPMGGNETRKVKITYLVPTEWTARSVTAPLPTNLLRTSRFPVATFHLLTWLDREWHNPRLVEFQDITFKEFNDEVFGSYIRADIPSSAVTGALNFEVDSPLKNGVYLNSYGDQFEGYYQLVYLPSEVLALPQSHKVAILFDYNGSNSNVSASTVIHTVRNALHTTFAAGDSFNLIFSRLNILRASENWLSADSVTIENTFANLGSEPLANYSNLPALLANGVEFVQAHGNDGSLLLISNSDQVGNYQVANQLINDLLELMNPTLPVHVADFQNRNTSYHFFGGRTYRGNEYFYANISRLTSGNFLKMRSGYTFTELLSGIFQSLSGFISSFDLHTTLENGFCFARFSSATSGQSIYLNRPILQVGKYNGAFPFIVESSGVFKSEAFSKSVSIPEQDMFNADTLAKEIWAGRYIQSLEQLQQSNDIVNEIVDYSLRERVLSLYTAFIALEPSDTVSVCYDCYDESEIISAVETVETDAASDSMLQAYPNPFNARTTIKIKLPASTDTRDLSFRIFNIMGQAVKTFDLSAYSDTREYTLIWDGTNDHGQQVSSGHYFFVATTSNWRQSLKLVLLK